MAGPLPTSSKPPILDFLTPAEGWEKLADAYSFTLPFERHCYASFVRDGIQFMASVKDYPEARVIHVTLAPLYSMQPDIRPECLEEYMAKETPDIIRAFFGDRVFTRQHDDPRSPQCKHYFSVLN